MAPWWARQLAVFGSLSPSTASGRVLFIRSIDEWDSITTPATLDHLLGMGIGPLLVTRLGGLTPRGVLESTDEELRSDGFSRQKNRYARALAAAVADGALDLEAVAELDDVDVRTALVALPGIGPWTAEVYLLSALRRPDTWPTGDIALQEGARRAKGLELRPSSGELEAIGEAWRPHRATAARLLWHLYLSENGRRETPV